VVRWRAPAPDSEPSGGPDQHHGLQSCGRHQVRPFTRHCNACLCDCVPGHAVHVQKISLNFVACMCLSRSTAENTATCCSTSIGKEIVSRQDEHVCIRLPLLESAGLLPKHSPDRGAARVLQGVSLCECIRCVACVCRLCLVDACYVSGSTRRWTCLTSRVWYAQQTAAHNAADVMLCQCHAAGGQRTTCGSARRRRSHSWLSSSCVNGQVSGQYKLLLELFRRNCTVWHSECLPMLHCALADCA